MFYVSPKLNGNFQVVEYRGIWGYGKWVGVSREYRYYDDAAKEANKRNIEKAKCCSEPDGNEYVADSEITQHTAMQRLTGQCPWCGEILGG